jgi:predicted transcriptional regulator of viral defense system
MAGYPALVERAVDQHGLVTIADAEQLGIGAHRLRRWAAEGLVSRFSQGVYRVEALAGSPREQLQAALLWPRVDAVLCGETALDLHELCDVNPNLVHVAVPWSWRLQRQVPKWLALHRRDVPLERRTRVDGLSVVNPAQAILEAIEFDLGDRFVEESLSTARRRALLTTTDEHNIEVARLNQRLAALHRGRIDDT